MKSRYAWLVITVLLSGAVPFPEGIGFCGTAMAAGLPTYTLSIPEAPILRDTTDPSLNAWLSSNTAFSVAACFAPESGSVPMSSATFAGLPSYSLTSGAAGFSLERIKPAYYLGELITPPANVDWTATYALFQTNLAENSAFVFDPQGERIFTIVGGTHNLTWVLTGGNTITLPYILGSVSRSRPYRIFWTDSPYDSPKIDLSGKFVKFFGDPDIVNPEYGTKTNYVAGLVQVVSNTVVRGLYLDSLSKLLYAYGTIRGQVVMVYYDSGSYDTIRHVQVVEVAKPDVIEMTGVIGKQIVPSGSGFMISGLVALPKAQAATDNRGDYYYQHRGAHSYSPKNDYVYPLRPTIGESWRLPVYWMEYDPFDTSWPFELCHYACDWGSDAQIFVRGDVAGDSGRSIIIPSDYTVNLMNYQEPEGHAQVPVDGGFATTGEGYSMLKLMTTDNVWFVPIHSITRSDTNFFKLVNEKWSVGDEIRPRGGSVMGTAEGYSPHVDSSVAGYIYKPVSSPNFNPDIYAEPTVNSGIPSVPNSNTGDTNAYPSVIYAVSTHAKPIEVWWSSTVLLSDMPTALQIPSLVQRYEIFWPGSGEVPQIVIASQKGSASESIYQMGAALVFDTPTGSLELSDRYFFNRNAGSVGFWVKTAEAAPGTNALITLGHDMAPHSATTASVQIDVLNTPNGNTYRMTLLSTNGIEGVIETENLAATGKWQKILFSIAETNLVVYVNGELNAQTTFSGAAEIDCFMSHNAIGAIGSRNAPVGYEIDDIAVWSTAFSSAAAQDDVYRVLDGYEFGLSSLYSFYPETDLVPVIGSNKRTALERVYNLTASAVDVLCDTPGSPGLGVGIIEADKTPIIYTQNNPHNPGYNPNEEHAIITSGYGGYVAWALRCDLNAASSSEPGVLVEYVKDGQKAMRYFAVVLTNELSTVLADSATVGTILPGPHPLDMMDDPWLPQTYWESVDGRHTPAFRDRKKQVWSRCEGSLPIHMYYAMQDGFYFPSLDAGKQPLIGAPIPWLSSLNAIPDASVNTKEPVTWTWSVTWPKNVETMRIGQTLTTASGGLPEVWNAKSVAVVYPDQTVDQDHTVMLVDPTVIQKSGTTLFTKLTDFLAAFDITTGKGGNASIRSGKYHFKDMPPSISERFYLNTNLALSECLCLEGKREQKTGGQEVLYINVLNDQERQALKAIVPDRNQYKGFWDGMIDRLARTSVQPSVPKWTGARANDLAFTYTPRDHYALTAMGATNYVVIIENDTTHALMNVKAGDPISMHVFSVTNQYYTGAVVAREDPENLLSQQLAILYTESFGGVANNYVFEWKKATPNANGTIPTDYENGFQTKFAIENSIGLTRFIIGGQGDTLANMVNTYYVCRYRATSATSPAYPVMGYEWSGWCGPTLAEGWIQRVLNNVTPFTQRMQNLYENKAETMATMIQEAGGAYEGDVALNQDNLTSIGLIQLYQTVLNKAESMSVSLGINYGEANKQLLLATQRLADLYVVLGDEAYADSLNPTIGFGTTYGSAAPGILSVDYGAESSSLFCFDNQLPSLLDEELALLRGRSGENAPVVTTSPYYNRLVWNFTKGITAGEVAYAVNYNINSSDGDATITAQDAARQYPQGHGDAWGHYLSALSGYYRLLRNPSFSWGVVGMSEMLVNDAVVNVDYYDEARFVGIAAKLVKTATDVMDRTARKVWRDTGTAKGAGYLDTNTERNFGYGEWATRGGIGAVMNWMVANSLLPEAEDSSHYYQLAFDGSTQLTLTDAPIGAENATNGVWTFECQIEPSDILDDCEVVSWQTDDSLLGVSMNAQQHWNVSGYELTEVFRVETNDFVTVTTNITEELGAWVTNIVTDTYSEITYHVETETNVIVSIDCGSFPSWGLLAIGGNSDGSQSIRLLDATGACVTNVTMTGLTLAGGTVSSGQGFKGSLRELRIWSEARTDTELLAHMNYVNPRTSGLLASVRTISKLNSAMTLADETDLGRQWLLTNPRWVSAEEGGMTIAFTDDGLLRIDRASVSDLRTLAVNAEILQTKLNQLDAGMNPLGLSEYAIPFDITPLGVDNGTATHFEQISGRAQTALENAAKVLDRAQTLSARLRMIQNAESDEEEALSETEESYNQQLIQIFGYPYENDIGPAGTYVQGYNGPDLIHFMWTDLKQYGLASTEDLQSKSVIRYNFPASWWANAAIFNTLTETSKTLTFALSANGLIVKPDTITGTRRASGKVQQAYADYILAYVQLSNAIDWYDRKSTTLDAEATAAEIALAISQTKLVAMTGVHIYQLVQSKLLLAAKQSLILLNASMDMVNYTGATVNQSTPSVLGVGLTVNTDPSAIVSATVGSIETPLMMANISSKASVESIINGLENSTWGTFVADELNTVGTFNSEKRAIRDRLVSALAAQLEAANNVQTAWAKMVNAYAVINTLVAEGERILESRESHRTKAVNRITKLRYNDMYFRQVRDPALTRYSAAFDLAQKYVFLAAQAYDYETGLLSADMTSGNAFRAEIIGARSIGHLAANNTPMLGDGFGDAGLSDILARMGQNWLVLKPRLGINNPENYATWFSLRRELFRIADGAEGTVNWQTELTKYWVEDLRAVPEYNRFCQPFSTSPPLKLKEPGLVIPFSSTIDFAKNFFGKELRGGDSSYDSTYFATKIAGGGVQFVGYNGKINGYTGPDALSKTPVVYLLPVGADRMRVPGSGENGKILDFNIVDQVVPLPHLVGSSELDSEDWTPLYDGYTGNVDIMARIRRYPSFRAATGVGDDAPLTCARLVGRSVWNSQWVIIIPAGAMTEDRINALNTFIYGKDVNRDGILDISGVSDIKLGFKTYSNSGN